MHQPRRKRGFPSKEEYFQKGRKTPIPGKVSINLWDVAGEIEAACEYRSTVASYGECLRHTGLPKDL